MEYKKAAEDGINADRHLYNCYLDKYFESGLKIPFPEWLEANVNSPFLLKKMATIYLMVEVK